MKFYLKFFVTLFWTLVLVVSELSAQNPPKVNGYVQDEDGNPLCGVLLVVSEDGKQGLSREDGSFEIETESRGYITASLDQFISESLEIDGTLLIFVLKKDKDYEKRKARAEREAQLAAERAEKERIAAEEKAKRDAEEAARKEAEAKAKAERAAQIAAIKAEQERIAAEEKAKRDAVAKAKKEENLSKDNEYDERFKNKGFEHRVSASYSYSFSAARIIYKYSGVRNYTSLHPLELDYTLSYRFNRLFSIGLGLGFLYNLRSVTIKGDEMVGNYSGFQEKRWDIPLYLSLSLRPLRSQVRPIAELQVGYYFLSSCFTTEIDLGAEYRVGKGNAISLNAFFKLVPYPAVTYKPASAIGVKLGFSF